MTDPVRRPLDARRANVDDASVPLKGLDHVNIRTSRLQLMKRFYIDVLGLTLGRRPPFDFEGAWLYCGEQPVIHLVEVAETSDAVAPRVDHFAFRAASLAAFLRHLNDYGVAYRIGKVPGWNTVQINCQDPDGNHLHVDFAAEEPLAR